MQTAPTYPDRWMWRYLAPLVALGAVHIANDNTLWELLHIPSYYTDLLFAFLFTYACFWYVRKLSLRLDREPDERKRILKQVLLGVALPTTIVIGAEMVYLVFLLEIPLSESPIFYLELPITFLFLALVNLLYYILHLRQGKNAVPQPPVQSPQTENFPASETKEEVRFFVQSGQHQLAVHPHEVAYFYLDSKCLWLFTSTGEQYMLNDTLDQIQQKVDPESFFRLNRQCIAHRHSIKKTAYTETRKLEVSLLPENTWEIFVSKANAGAFQRWWKN